MTHTAPTEASVATNSIQKPLRWWPAAILVIAMVILRILPNLFESSPMVLMSAFMGPAGLGLLVMVWWIVASRAGMREKIIGLVAMVTLGVVATLLCHYTMKDMGLMIYVIPYGTAAFTIPLILFAMQPTLRLPLALVGAVVGFGYCDLLKLGGFSFSLGADLSWRWESTAEEVYLKGLTGNQPSSSPKLDEPAVTLAASAWPGFRGAARDAKLVGLSLSEDWKATPPKLVWKTQIGPGWSSFSVAGDRLFTQEQRGEKEAVVCLDAKTGKTVWEHEYVARFWETVAGAGPRATPTISDEGLFSLGANGILTCLNASTGAKIWERDLQVDANRKPPMWGFSSSPLVTEGLVIVHAGGPDDNGILAYDAVTGEPRWRAASGDHSYSSAQTASFFGVSGVLMESNIGLQFISTKDGSKIWQFDAPIQNYRALQPLVLGNSIFLASSLGDGTKRLSVTRERESWDIKQEWASRDMKSDFNDFVAYQGSLYGFDGNILACVDLGTGKRQWKKRALWERSSSLTLRLRAIARDIGKRRIGPVEGRPKQVDRAGEIPSHRRENLEPLRCCRKPCLHTQRRTAACYELPTP